MSVVGNLGCEGVCLHVTQRWVLAALLRRPSAQPSCRGVGAHSSRKVCALITASVKLCNQPRSYITRSHHPSTPKHNSNSATRKPPHTRALRDPPTTRTHAQHSRMQSQASADLMGIGKHCAFPECGQLDFLPFECACGATFCLEHRQPSAHGCRLANAGDCRQVIVCPLCAQGVELGPSDDPNAVFDRHQRAGCDPANYARVHKKPRCPVKGCKEKLTTINTYTCKDCRQTVCLKHRLSIDHACAGPAVGASGASAAAGQRAAAAFAAAAAASRSFGNRASSMVSELAAAASGATRGGGGGGGGGSSNTGNAAAQQRQQRAAARSRQQQQRAAEDPANSVHGSAQRRQQLLQQQGAERCPQCGAAFSDVAALILHIDRAHSGASGAAAPAGTGGQQRRQGDVFVCPRCSQQFADAVLLVTHSEGCGRRDTGSCALS